MKLKVIGPYELSEALSAIGAPVSLAYRDPVRCMRFAASADLDALRRALAAVMVDPPEIEAEDEARLFGAAVIAQALTQARGKNRGRDVEEHAVPAL